MDPTPFADRNVILKLTLRAFRSRRKDRKATNNLAANTAASVTQIAVLKTLLPEDVFAAVYAHDRETYAAFNKVTLPWLDGSEEQESSGTSATDGGGGESKPAAIGRICRTVVFPEVMAEMKARQDARQPLIEQGLAAYAKLLDNPDTLRAHLGTLYREEDYPSVGKVRKAFAFAVRVFPVPSDDWRCHMAAEELDQVRNLAASQREEAARNAQRCLVEQIEEPLKKVRDMLLKPDGERRVVQATLSALQDMGQRIKALNVTDHPIFDEVSELIATDCSGSADYLRDHAGRRARTARAAQSIMDKLSGFMGSESEPVVAPVAEPDPAHEEDSGPATSPMHFGLNGYLSVPGLPAIVDPIPTPTPEDELLALAGAL